MSEHRVTFVDPRRRYDDRESPRSPHGVADIGAPVAISVTGDLDATS
jgi:hypothetical protein